MTFKYPTAVAKPKKAEKAKTKSKVETDSSGNPWKYSLDGSITGGVKIKNLFAPKLSERIHDSLLVWIP